MRQALQFLERKTSTAARRCCESELHRACGVWQRTGAVGACIEKVVNYWHAYYNENLLFMFLNQTRVT
jgi:hypothetical protein